jgi:hypothetical protein
MLLVYLSIAYAIAPDMRISVNDELGRIQKEIGVEYFKIPSLHFHDGNEEKS